MSMFSGHLALRGSSSSCWLARHPGPAAAYRSTSAALRHSGRSAVGRERAGSTTHAHAAGRGVAGRRHDDRRLLRRHTERDPDRPSCQRGASHPAATRHTRQ